MSDMVKQIWTVIGGVENGGIIVRLGEHLSSAKCSSRLGPGAAVEELSLNGHRLRFRKISGTGPSEGWVSVRQGSRALLEPMKKTNDFPNSSCLAYWLCPARATSAPSLLQCLQKSLSRLWHEKHENAPSALSYVWQAGGFSFFASFDSGNCADVSLSDDGVRNIGTCKDNTLCFKVRVRNDCAGTPFEKDTCQWFYFGMRGCMQPGQKLRFQILGLSRFQHMDGTGTSGRLLTDGLCPVVGTGRNTTDWRFVSGECGIMHMQDGSVAFCFEHRVEARQQDTQELFFASCFPYPLSKVTQHLQELHGCGKDIYINRECLVHSLGARPIELLVITHSSSRTEKRQPDLEGLPSKTERPWIFEGRRAVFISARVHPGETPASFTLEGLLNFLVSGTPVADALLKRYVFHIVPVLNPDGVELGHHRLDTRGANLNRVYDDATLEEHPSIRAAMLACFCAHDHQGGLRLYLDLHAHSNRRGAFLLGDIGKDSTHHVTSKLFAYALGRHCNIFEYNQCLFNPLAAGTGKSAIAARTGVGLCFTVETNYRRGHHQTVPFVPADWRRLGESCLQALLEMDLLEESNFGAMLPGISMQERIVDDMMKAEDWLVAECEGVSWESLCIEGPSRACPAFGKIVGSSPDQPPSKSVLLHPELIGSCVEIVEKRLGRYRLHECDGGYCFFEHDLILQERQHGRFFYGVLSDVHVTLDAEISSPVVRVIPLGAVLEADERIVVDGLLRVHIAQDSIGGNGGWASEYKSSVFDHRLGGVVQLMRLSSARRFGDWEGLRHYAFGS